MNYASKFFLVLFFCTAILSCKQPRSTHADFELNSFKDSIKFTTGEKYLNDSLKLINPRFIKYHPDSFLVVQEIGTPYLIKIIDLTNGHIQELIQKGTGKNQMVVAYGINIINRVVSVFDGFQKKVCLIKKDKNRNFRIEEEIQFQDKDIFSICQLSKKKIVALGGIKSKERLVYFDDKGAVIKRFGDFPRLTNNDKIKSDNNIFHAQIASSWEAKKFVLATSGSDVIEVYKDEGVLIKRFQGPVGLILKAKKVDVGVGQMTITIPSFRGYNSIDAGEQEFWTGYVGFSMEKGVKPKRGELLAKNIFCFSWDGKPLRRLEFSNGMKSFAVDWKSGTIYCLTFNPAPEISIFKLKSN